MSTHSQNLSIGALAAAAGVNVQTIRFYQRKGLLAQPTRDRGTIRRYAADDVARVQFIKAAKGLGFSLVEIASLLRLDGAKHCDQARAMAEQKLSDVRSRLLNLHRLEIALEALVSRCGAQGGAVVCPLIASLQAG